MKYEFTPQDLKVLADHKLTAETAEAKIVETAMPQLRKQTLAKARSAYQQAYAANEPNLPHYLDEEGVIAWYVSQDVYKPIRRGPLGRS